MTATTAAAMAEAMAIAMVAVEKVTWWEEGKMKTEMFFYLDIFMPGLFRDGSDSRDGVVMATASTASQSFNPTLVNFCHVLFKSI